MTVEYLYQLIGMKEAALSMVVAERDQIKAKLNEAEKEIRRLSDVEGDVRTQLTDLQEKAM